MPRKQPFHPAPLLSFLVFVGIVGTLLYRDAGRIRNNSVQRSAFSAQRTRTRDVSPPNNSTTQHPLSIPHPASRIPHPPNPQQPLSPHLSIPHPASRIPHPPNPPNPQQPLFDALTTHSNLLWKVGKLNGLPRDGFQKLVRDEYPVLSSPGKVVRIRDSRDFVQLILPRQSLVIHLGGLTPQDAILRLALQSSREPVYDQVKPCDFANRRLKIQFNDDLAWWRWLPAGHFTVETYICADWMHPEENILTIQNEGSEVLCVDAAWLAPLSPGPALFAALDSAQELDRTAALHVPVCHLALPPPMLSTSHTTDIQPILRGLPQRNVPIHAMHAVKQWRTLREPVAGRPLFSLIRGDAETTWRLALARALQRTMLPIVETQATGPPDAWRLWAQRFGPFVAHWILSGSENDFERTAAAIRDRVPQARITREQSLAEHPIGYWGARSDTLPGRLRRQYWNSEPSSPRPFDGWLRLQDPYFWCDVSTQRKHARMFPESMVQWWMAGGNKLIVPAGHKGGTFFPDATAAPAASWEAMKPLLAFGDGSSTRSIGNVLPQGHNRSLADTCWVTAVQGIRTVSMLLYAGPLDQGHSARITVPVPWVGKTRCRIEAVRLQGKSADPKPLPVSIKHHLAVGTAPLKRLIYSQAAATNGSVTLSHSLSSIQLLRFTPLGRPWQPRRLLLGPTTPSPAPQSIAGLFTVIERPLAPNIRLSPLRSPNGLADPLSIFARHETVEASPGTVVAWRTQGISSFPQITTIRNVSPRNTESDQVTLTPPDLDHNFPVSVRLYWNRDAVSPGDRATFWVRSKARTLLLGTCEKRQRLTLKSDQWQRVSFAANAIRNRDGSFPRCLILWLDSRTDVEQVFEFNGFSVLKSTTDSGTALGRTRGRVRLLDKKDEWLIALSGEAGKPGTWRCRFPNPIEIQNITRLQASGQADGCTFRYYRAAQLLEIDIDRFPALTRIPPGYTGLTDRTLNSLVLLTCIIRQ